MYTVMCHCMHQPVHRVSSATVYHYQWMWFIVVKRGKKSGFVELTDWQCWGMRDWKPLWSGIAWNSWPTIVLSLWLGVRGRGKLELLAMEVITVRKCNKRQWWIGLVGLLREGLQWCGKEFLVLSFWTPPPPPQHSLTKSYCHCLHHDPLPKQRVDWKVFRTLRAKCHLWTGVIWMDK